MRDVNIAILGFGFMGKVYAYAAESLKHFYPDAPKVKISNVLISKSGDQESLKSRFVDGWFARTTCQQCYFSVLCFQFCVYH